MSTIPITLLLLLMQQGQVTDGASPASSHLTIVVPAYEAVAATSQVFGDKMIICRIYTGQSAR